jgi:hypothetical protein
VVLGRNALHGDRAASLHRAPRNFFARRLDALDERIFVQHPVG